jgi:hypothetical protein
MPMSGEENSKVDRVGVSEVYRPNVLREFARGAWRYSTRGAP